MVFEITQENNAIKLILSQLFAGYWRKLFKEFTVVCILEEARYKCPEGLKHTVQIPHRSTHESKHVFALYTETHNIKPHQIVFNSNVNVHYPHSCKIHLDTSLCSETWACIETLTDMDIHMVHA